MTTTAQMMADAIDINTRCCGRDCTDCPRKVSTELRRLAAAHTVAVELAAQYAAERDQLRAQVERLQGGEPTHWRAVLAEEQRPHELRTDRHILLFRKKRDAESWIASALDFDGWRYSLEPLYTAQPAAPAMVPLADRQFDLICQAIDKADTITMDGDYMMDSGDCIAVVRVMQALFSIAALREKEELR